VTPFTLAQANRLDDVYAHRHELSSELIKYVVDPAFVTDGDRGNGLASAGQRARELPTLPDFPPALNLNEAPTGAAPRFAVSRHLDPPGGSAGQAQGQDGDGKVTGSTSS